MPSWSLPTSMPLTPNSSALPQCGEALDVAVTLDATLDVALDAVLDATLDVTLDVALDVILDATVTLSNIPLSA